jgi:iron complex outermembrane receptor protein
VVRKNFYLAVSSVLALVSATSALADTTSATATSASTDAAPPQSGSAGGLSEITVTARRREENLQSVPVQASVVSAATINAASTFTPALLQETAPGLEVTPFNGDRSNIILTIRGQAYSTGSLFPAVYPYLAEVPLTKLTTGNFYDLENIEVLRGPQGTLFGRVTDGGNVMIQPARPTNEFGGYGEVKVGNYDEHAFDGAVNVPIIDDKLMIRGAFEINRRDGYSQSLTTGQKFDNVHYESARLSIIARPFEGFENYTTLWYNHANESGGSAVLQYVNSAAVIRAAASSIGTPAATALANALQQQLAAQQNRSPYLTNSDLQSFDLRHSVYLTNKSTWEVSDHLTAKLILGYVRYKQFVQNDADGTNLPYSTYLGLLPTSLNNQRQLSGEFQLQGSFFNEKLKYTIGTYVDQQKTGSPSETYTTSLNFSERVTPQSVKTTSTAGYGQVSYEIVHGLTAEAGVRYTHDTSAANTAAYNALYGVPLPHGQCLNTLPAGAIASTSQTCTFDSASFNSFTYLGSLQWQVRDHVFAYAKFSKGYRPGGFNATEVAFTYGPEQDYSKEAGVKTDFHLANIPMRLNVAGFYDDFKNIQRFTTFRNGTVSTSGTINGKSAVIKGIELEYEAVPFTGLKIGATWNYLKAKYFPSEYSAADIAAACPANPLTTVPDTTKFCPFSPYARTPANVYTFNVRYTLPINPEKGEISIGANFYHTDSEYSISTSYINPNVLVPAYNLVNADITWHKVMNSNFDLSVFSTNLFNNHYLLSVSSGTYLGGSGIGFAMYGEPRMFGGRVRYTF